MKRCEHQQPVIDENGAPIGSWKIEEHQQGRRVVCAECGQFYGYLARSNSREEKLRRAYLEQQRRLNCPGCGEEPFFG